VIWAFRKFCKMEDEYNRLIESYRRGDHLDIKIIKRQKDDIELEAKLYQSAADIISNAGPMRDYDKLHIGNVVVPENSIPHNQGLERQEKYINLTHERISLFEKFKRHKDEVFLLKSSISDDEDRAGAIIAEIEKFRFVRDFDWQVEMHNTVRSIKANISVTKEDLEYASEKLRLVIEEVQRKYPDMSTSIERELNSVSEESAGLTDITPGNNSGNISSEMVNAEVPATPSNASLDIGKLFGDTASGEVYGWILGKLSRDNKIEIMLYSQFTRDSIVPASGWIFMGQIIDQHLDYGEVL